MTSYPPTSPAVSAGPSLATLWKLGTFVFVSTTPALGESAGLVATGLGLLVLLGLLRRPNPHALQLMLLFVVLILPISIYDLIFSTRIGFVTMSFIAIPVLLFSGFVLSQSTGDTPYLQIYERVFLYIAVPSFIVFVIVAIRPDIAYLFPEYTYRETTHRTAFILNVVMNPDPVMRNAGFASEPGFYQLLVNVALYARLRRLGQPDRICGFYLLVVLSTVSTAGIAVALFLVSTKFDARYRLLLIALIVIFFGATQEFLLGQYESKIANDAVFGPRFMPSVSAFHFFLDNPLGIGSVEYTLIYQQYDLGSWDSYTQIAMRYGLPGLLGFAVLLGSLGRRYPALLGVFILSFITSPIWFLPAISAFYFPSGRNEQAMARIPS